MTPRRGEVYACSLGETVGSEQRGTRSVVVVSNDAFNAALDMVTIVPVATFRRASGAVYPSEALLPASAGKLRAESLALCHQVRTIARARLQRRIGELPAGAMREVDEALATHLALRA